MNNYLKEYLNTRRCGWPYDGRYVVRYSISVEHWAYQIYDNLGFEVESRDEETINFVRYT